MFCFGAHKWIVKNYFILSLTVFFSRLLVCCTLSLGLGLGLECSGLGFVFWPVVLLTSLAVYTRSRRWKWTVNCGGISTSLQAFWSCSYASSHAAFSLPVWAEPRSCFIALFYYQCCCHLNCFLFSALGHFSSFWQCDCSGDVCMIPLGLTIIVTLSK